MRMIGPKVHLRFPGKQPQVVELRAAGHLMARKYRGSQAPRPFNPATIKRMIEGPMPA
jgi:hypothetical protein